MSFSKVADMNSNMDSAVDSDQRKLAFRRTYHKVNSDRFRLSSGCSDATCAPLLSDRGLSDQKSK